MPAQESALRETIFSGIQPSGELHLGNYLGAIRNWVDLQSSYRCFFCIVDYHAITQPFDPNILGQRVREMACDLIACGIDPAKSTLFVQSAVREHTELAWALASVTGYGELGRMTQFKDKAEKNPDNINAGLFHVSRAASRGHFDLPRDQSSGGRGSTPTPGAGARDRAQVERALRRDLSRARGALFLDAEDPGSRRPGQDVEEPGQHHLAA